MKTLEEKLQTLPAHRQQAIAARADALILEEMTLQALRKALTTYAPT
jgi:transcriptional regulator with AAA-type ATPase domain